MWVIFVVLEASIILGGRLLLHSPPGAGTTLEVHIPMRNGGQDRAIQELGHDPAPIRTERFGRTGT